MPATRCCGTATGPGSGQLRKPRRESRMRLYRLRKPAETDRSATARIGELTAALFNRLVSSTKRTKELLMVKTALYAAIGFAAISSIAWQKTFLRRWPRCLPGHSRRQRTLTHG